MVKEEKRNKLVVMNTREKKKDDREGGIRL